MNATIDVEICTGTTCYVMGAGHLLNLEEELPAELRQAVAIRGAHCLNVCHEASRGRPPFARVNGRLLANVSRESIIEACEAVLQAEGGGHATL